MEPLENWVKMFTDGEEEEEDGGGDGMKENYNLHPDFHVVIALDPSINPKTQLNNIPIFIFFKIFLIFLFLFFIFF